MKPGVFQFKCGLIDPVTRAHATLRVMVDEKVGRDVSSPVFTSLVARHSGLSTSRKGDVVLIKSDRPVVKVRGGRVVAHVSVDE